MSHFGPVVTFHTTAGENIDARICYDCANLIVTKVLPGDPPEGGIAKHEKVHQMIEESQRGNAKPHR